MSFKKIIDSEVVKSVLTLSAGSIISQLLPILIAPVLARIYLPEDFGEWGVFSSYASIILIFVCGRYEYAIVRAKTKSDAINLAFLSIMIAIVLTTILLLSILLLDYFQLQFIKVKYKYLLPFYILFLGFFQVFCNFSNWEEEYKRIAFSNVTKSIGQASTRIFLGVTRFLKGGLVIGAIIGAILQSSYLYGKSPIFNKNRRFISYARIIELLKRYKKYPLFDLPSGLMNAFSTNIPIILFARLFSEVETGYFTMTITLLYLPMTFIGSALGQVFYKKSCLYTDEDLASFAYRILTLSTIIGSVFLIFILTVGQSFFILFLGEKWLLAGDYAVYMSLCTSIVSIFAPMSQIFQSKDKQHYGLIYNSLLFLGRIITILFGALYLESPGMTVLLYSLVGFVVWIVEGGHIMKLSYIRGKYLKKMLPHACILLLLFVLWLFKVLSIV